MKQTVTNGTGLSQNYGLLKFTDPNPPSRKPGICASSYPAGATKDNTFLQVSSVTGACNLPQKGDFSVATFPSPNAQTDYSCKDAILLTTQSNTNFSVKEADDYCPDCKKVPHGANAHIDNYSPSNACKLDNLGKFWTADTHGETQ